MAIPGSTVDMNAAFKKEDQAWYAEFLLEINLKILLRKTGARLNYKITLISLHIDPGLKSK
jgi:hypothetical protein